MKARRLKAIADYINANAARLELSRATVEPWTSSTDRDIPGTRLRHPGRGRKGVRIVVYNLGDKVLLDHRSSETYRQNYEVEHWLACWEHGLVRTWDGWVDRNGLPLSNRSIAQRMRGVSRWPWRTSY